MSDEIARMSAEIAHLRQQRDELQNGQTRLATENRGLRAELAARRGSNAPSDRRADIMAFFAQVTGHEIAAAPRVPNQDNLKLYLRLILEEVIELVDACGADISDVDDLKFTAEEAIMSVNIGGSDLTKIADGAIDSLYTIEGLLVACGIHAQPVWDLIHANNMTKADGPIVNGKRMKPPGHRPPNVRGELERQGAKL